MQEAKDKLDDLNEQAEELLADVDEDLPPAPPIPEPELSEAASVVLIDL